MTIIWCMVPEILSIVDRIFCHFGPFFTLLTPVTTQKIKILKNWKKTSRDIIILYKCTETHDHMLYSSLDTACNGYDYFSFWAIFRPFTPLTAQKIKIKKKNEKKYLEISSFYTRLPKIMITCYTVPEIWCVADISVIFHFGLFFALSPPPPWQPKKSKLKKKWKKHLEISSSYICVPKIMIRWHMVSEI